MSTRADWGEGSSSVKEDLKKDDTISLASEISRMSFEAARPSADWSISLERKVIGYKTRTVSEPIYEDELVKNMTMEICYEATNRNPNSNYIPIKVCLETYNKYKLCVCIDSGCFMCFEKRSLFPGFMWKTDKNPLHNSIVSHNETIKGLSIQLGGTQCIIPILWITDQPSHDMITRNNFQRLYSPCTQTINQIIFTINGHSVPIKKLSQAYTH